MIDKDYYDVYDEIRGTNAEGRDVITHEFVGQIRATIGYSKLTLLDPIMNRYYSTPQLKGRANIREDISNGQLIDYTDGLYYVGSLVVYGQTKYFLLLKYTGESA